MTETTRTQYAMDFGDEIEILDSDLNLEAALRYSSLTSQNRPDDQPDLYEHTLVKRTVTVAEGDWEPVRLAIRVERKSQDSSKGANA